jgi:L-cysteine:1D-myo-inositol 2-amino-2-deoxy-alpha-D-glucopyranoside ligase
LAVRELGVEIDLHGGGRDLIYPHHECEAAQAEAATGRPFVRHWMHTAMVTVGGVKMSKSAGNLVFVSDLRRSWDPMVIRLALTSRHYLEPWDWSDTLLDVAAERLGRWRSSGPGEGALDDVRAALDDDLDVPEALGFIDRAARKGAGVGAALELLGLAG